MKARKFLCAVMIVLAFAAGASAARKPEDVRGGVLRYLGTTEEAFQQGIDEMRKVMMMTHSHPEPNSPMNEAFQLVQAFKENRHVFMFFDSLTSMLMTLNAGKVDEISLPESTARYVMRNDPEVRILFTIRMPSAIAFGFRGDSTALRDEFNGAIATMRADGTLADIEKKYIGNGSEFQSDAVNFEDFEGAETIKIAVTGDMPPVDYVDEEGMAAGYNTAVISEIGKRLKKNVEIVSIESGARSSALTSGRADVIFWYRTTKGVQIPEVEANSLNAALSDASEEVILSEPYYSWERSIFLTK